MSADSVTQICNVALSRLGHKRPITNIDDDTSEEGDQCRLHYPIVRKSMLRAHPWNFAIRRATLTQMTATPAFEYSYQYQMPNDYLKMVRTSFEALGWSTFDAVALEVWGRPQVPYRIEGSADNNGKRVLLVSESSVQIEYVADVTDVSTWDSLFTDALIARLAAELCYPLTMKEQLTKALYDIASVKLSEARVMDAQEGSARAVIDDSGWLMARL